MDAHETPRRCALCGLVEKGFSINRASPSGVTISALRRLRLSCEGFLQLWRVWLGLPFMSVVGFAQMMKELMTMGKGTQMKPIEQLLTTWYVTLS